MIFLCSSHRYFEFSTCVQNLPSVEARSFASIQQISNPGGMESLYRDPRDRKENGILKEFYTSTCEEV